MIGDVIDTWLDQARARKQLCFECLFAVGSIHPQTKLSWCWQMNGPIGPMLLSVERKTQLNYVWKIQKRW